MARRPIFFDTETTGTFAERDRIIELAAFDPYEKRSFQCFINPGIPIPKDAIAIHEITNEMIKDAGNFAQVAREFFDFVSGEVALIAHNGDSFDVPFMRAECRRHNLSLPADWIYIDSLKWARRYRRDLPRHSLQYLRQMYSVQPNKAHRALDDSLILAEIFLQMIDDLTIEQVYERLESSKAKAAPASTYAAPKDTQKVLSLFT